MTDAIDPATFTLVRLGSGALALASFARLTTGPSRPVAPGSRWRAWGGAVALALYAVPFSFAYARLDAGIGALLLFASVQVTMIAHGLATGDRPTPRAWLGSAGALVGLVVLTWPGASAVDRPGAASMVLSGVGWGAYSRVGAGEAAPARALAASFWRAALLVAPLAWLALPRLVDTTREGLALALASGVLVSGVGYVAWYAALPALGAPRAALVQLAVPVLAASFGVALLDEAITARLAVSGALVIGGVALGLRARSRDAPAREFAQREARDAPSA